MVPVSLKLHHSWIYSIYTFIYSQFILCGLYQLDFSYLTQYIDTIPKNQQIKIFNNVIDLDIVFLVCQSHTGDPSPVCEWAGFLCFWVCGDSLAACYNQP